MKSCKIFLALSMSLAFPGCSDLDLNPLSEGSSENWNSNDVEINMSLNDLYKSAFWPVDIPDWTDDWINREALTPITSATINGEWSTVASRWTNYYRAISRANIIINNLESREIAITEASKQRYLAEARFVRAYQYAQLVSYFGDVVLYTSVIPLEEAYTTARTKKEDVMRLVYEDFDFAIEHLPVSYASSEPGRATKGAAMAFKCRIALYNEDWIVAKDAAKKCMDLGVYKLYPDFGELFLSKTGKVDEIIYSVPRSTALGVSRNARGYLPRNVGGYCQYGPSWYLWVSFLCSDGLPIDESPLFDPRKPFENRDPRCSYTIVPFQSAFLGFIYQPHPDSTTVLNLSTGKYQSNNDTRSVQQFASFNGLALKKGVDETWVDDYLDDSDIIMMRYADVLLMYAEAKVELGEIDDSVLEAINSVRARAYKVAHTDVAAYPAVSDKDQASLRKLIRIERRMELAFEGTRYMDLIRWKLAEKALNKPNYGLLDAAELRERVVNKGLWFLPSAPPVDDDGIADFSEFARLGYIKQLTDGRFDASKQYLWPIPSKEVLINPNMKQNPNY